MPITRDRYRVAFRDPCHDAETEALVEVLGVDELRAEKAARQAGVRPVQIDARTRQVTDLGDFHNMEALKLWSALVRTGAYEDKALAFLSTDYYGSEKVDANGDPIKPDDEPAAPVDPTRPAENTDSV